MDLLEHPLEAVAFRLYSLPIPEAAASAASGATAWTCLAAVLAAAAAAGLWRLRASTPAAAVLASTKKPLELDPSSRAAVEVSSPEPSRPSSKPEPAAASTTTAAPSSPKERYTAYYRDAGCVGCCDVGGDEDGDENEEADHDHDDVEEHKDAGDRDVFVSSDAADPFGWDEVVRSLTLPCSPTARQYRRRSPTATELGGGSVVQLWDQGAMGGLTPTAASRLRGRVVVGAVSGI